MSKWIEEIFELQKEKKSFTIVTMIAIEGSAPQNVGAKMLVTQAGLYFGTVGGGKIENHCIEVAKSLLNKNINFETHKWNLQKDIGMTCGGVVNLSFEVIRTESFNHVAVFGAGHVAQELVPLLLKANFHVTIIDSRSEWLQKLKPEKNLKIVNTDNLSSIVDELNKNSYIVSMTMGHAHDLPILTRAFKLGYFPFVGVIGSQQKRNVLVKELIANGVDQILVNKLHCPIGEKIGGNEPFEIALSVVAQLINLRKE